MGRVVQGGQLHSSESGTIQELSKYYHVLFVANLLLTGDLFNRHLPLA